ncbi:hypothetical protein MGEO_11305 [Marivita geojedonensis]|uniref:Uncharacterized protein n=2 Tax=Marivita geojedonensis TaxID=1123756 RepID=A0A1X4NKR3_9RHOB|nr:hypothetical protein MGEO_11305 [Marivita geojedonensis]
MILREFALFWPRPSAGPFHIDQTAPYFWNKEINMPVTTFVSMILAVIAASGLTVWAMAQFGILKVLPALIALGLLARWGLAHVPGDDEPA